MGRKWTIRLWTGSLFLIYIVCGAVASWMPILSLCLGLLAIGGEIALYAMIRHRQIPGLIVEQTWREFGINLFSVLLAIVMLGCSRSILLGHSFGQCLEVLLIGILIIHFKIVDLSGRQSTKVVRR